MISSPLHIGHVVFRPSLALLQIHSTRQSMQKMCPQCLRLIALFCGSDSLQTEQSKVDGGRMGEASSTGRETAGSSMPPEAGEAGGVRNIAAELSEAGGDVSKSSLDVVEVEIVEDEVLCVNEGRGDGVESWTEYGVSSGY